MNNRTPQACRTCRQRKVKCDGQRPACQNCRKRQDDCEYPTTLLPGGYALDITNHQPLFSPSRSSPSMPVLPTEGSTTEQSQRSARRDNFQQRLLAIFWSTHHSVELCACIHRPSFETEYSEPQNEFLMCSISSLSAIYLSDAEARAHTNEITAASLSSSYAERARAISRRTSDSPSISAIQANLILGLRDLLQRSILSGWMYIGHSIRMSQGMRLRREFNQRLRPREKERRRRTFWACVTMDRLASYWCNRPPTIQLDAISIRLPMAEAAYAFDEESVAPTIDLLLQGANFESLSGLLQHFVVAVALWGQLSGEYAIGGRATAKDSPINPLSEIHSFHRVLLEYQQYLPASLKWSEESFRAHKSLGQGQLFVNLHWVIHHGLFVIQQEYLPQFDPFGNVDRTIGDAGCDHAGIPFNYRDEDAVVTCLQNARAISSISRGLSRCDDPAHRDIFQSTFAACALMSAAQVCLWGHFVEQHTREYSQCAPFMEDFTLSLDTHRTWSFNWKVCEGFVESLELLKMLYECAYGATQISTEKGSDNSSDSNHIECGETSSAKLSEGAGLPDPTTTSQRLYYQIRAISVLALEDKNFKRRCLAAFTKAMWPDIIGDDIMEAFFLTELDGGTDLSTETIFSTFPEEISKDEL
ncbi:fungal-specific transcription factor domain-containing protein [Talaromyces proteolyticus]|uniref:Fungal-specific transcription factor domain-containing protein n=1 Tax=Talaromyces proteolyticus TaxID=1131652 RepID=A0AAD4PVU3_9EURO|nr:fungal-specific transcription factor domain-containing protein [Talaromyces proteolyticus]KAH8690700.1 fungal-specific transcription factor domain-containing protein [Talaromyces proteolyticus]